MIVWLNEVPQVLVTGAVVGCFYAIVAMALQVVYGGTRILNFAQGDFVVVGMFAMWFLNVDAHLNVWLSLILVIPIGYVVGTIFDLVVIWPVSGRPMMESGLATLAGSILLQGIFLILFGQEYNLVPQFLDMHLLTVGEVQLTFQNIAVVVGSVMAVVALYVFMRSLRIGMAMRATAESREGACVIGIRPRTISSVTFGLSGAISAWAGALIVPVIGAQFDLGLNFVVYAFVAAVLGGLSSGAGAAAGGFVVGLTTSVIAFVFGSEFSFCWLLVIMVVLLYFRPHGVFGRLVWE